MFECIRSTFEAQSAKSMNPTEEDTRKLKSAEKLVLMIPLVKSMENDTLEFHFVFTEDPTGTLTKSRLKVGSTEFNCYLLKKYLWKKGTEPHIPKDVEPDGTYLWNMFDTIKHMSEVSSIALQNKREQFVEFSWENSNPVFKVPEEFVEDSISISEIKMCIWGHIFEMCMTNLIRPENTKK